MSEENILFQYQVKSKTTIGIRYYYFYANTDIENYLNNKNIKYVRYAKDTALNKKEKRIRELFNERTELRGKNTQLKSVLKEIRELLLNFNNGVCVMDGKEKPAFTKVLNFDETRELLWKILEIIDKAGIGEDK